MTSRTKAAPPCESLGQPHGVRRARLYPAGWLCDRHTPNAVRGLPEVPPGPGWPPGNYLNQLNPFDDEDQEQPDDDSTSPPHPPDAGQPGR